MKQKLTLLSLLAVVALPLVMLVWVQSTRDLTPHTVPIAGYDPRDLLRGRYMTFTYVWDRAEYKPKNAPETGRFYVDELDAPVLEKALQLSAPDQKTSTAVITFNMIKGDVTPTDLSLGGKPYKEIVYCTLNSGVEPFDKAIQTCLQQ